MASSMLYEDEPESDDRGDRFNTPLIQKPVLMIDGIDSATTLLTSPTSSRKSYSDLKSLVFNDNIKIKEIDCEYTDEQVDELWFTKVEYDDFLQSCDEDAQKCEAHEKELRVAKLKKDIRKQRRMRRKEEKRRNIGHDSEGSLMTLDMDDDIADDSLDGDSNVDIVGDVIQKEDDESLCSLGLDAWTLEGYQNREHHRKKALDAVLNEQYSAWNRGVIENPEMMSALYFAASATSKHAATKKGKELEAEVKQFMLVSTLEDYNRAVQTLNVLQKSLYIIKSKNPKSKGAKMNRRGSNESAKMKRRGSNESAKMKRRASNESTRSDYSSASMDRMLAITDATNDIAPRPPMNELSEGEIALKSEDPPPSSSTMGRKKIKPRGSKVSGTSHKIYKSKSSMNILVAPPTPPTVKARRVIKAGAPKPDLLAPPMSTKKSPKSRKVTYKPPSQITVDSSKSSKNLKTAKSNETKMKKKSKESKQRELNRSRSPGPTGNGSRRSSVSPARTSGRSGEKKRSKSPKTSGDMNKSRSRSPRASGERSKSRSRSPKSSGENRLRNKSPRRVVDKFRSKSPRSGRKLLQKINPTHAKKDKNAQSLESVKSVSSTENTSASSHASLGKSQTPKRESWWFSQNGQEVQ